MNVIKKLFAHDEENKKKSEKLEKARETLTQNAHDAVNRFDDSLKELDQLLLDYRKGKKEGNVH